MFRACLELDIPLAKVKMFGPSQLITYLGIEIDTVSHVICLPPIWLAELKILLSAWLHKKKCTKRQLLSLVGKLSFASKCVKPGRLFLRRIIDLSTSVKHLHHHVDLNEPVWADNKWWNDFLVTWIGISTVQSAPVSCKDIHFPTNASGEIGMGAVLSRLFYAVTENDGVPDRYGKSH